jgi:predicted permease
VKSLAAVRAYDVGIDLDRVIQASLPSRLEPAAARALYGQAMERLASIPGVQRVALSGGSLRLRTGRSTSMTPEGMTYADVKDRSMDAYFIVSPGYFATLGARVERGRDLTAEDDHTRARTAVVSRGFAERFWPGEETVGRCISFSIVFSRASCTTIVGVVENVVLHNRTAANEAQVFVLSSHPQFARDRPSALLIRTESSAADLVPVVRQTLQSLRPDMGYVDADTLEAMFAPQLQPWRLGSWMFLAFGAVALLIAAVGLYSSLAFAVSQRTQEIGIRMALGASPWNITETISASIVATMGIGIGLGLLGAALATRWLSDLLFQTSPRDPLVFATVAVVLALVGVTAGIVPARRAASVNPIVVLRDS